MASARQRNRALKRRRHFIDPGDLSPKIREGLTQDVSIEEIIADGRGKKAPDSVRAIQHMGGETQSGVGRVPNPHFVARNAVTGFIRRTADGREFADAEVTFTKEILFNIRAGLICLKCLEPQAYPFEDMHVPGCEGVQMRGPRYMRDWQIMDLAMEFEGETHIGPSKPMAEYEAEIEEKRLKREFAEKIATGGSRGRAHN